MEIAWNENQGRLVPFERAIRFLKIRRYRVEHGHFTHNSFVAVE